MAKAAKHKTVVNANEEIISRIHFVRGQKVMLDYDLAQLYEVETRVLNQSIKRNADRFPEDFMFRLTLKEWNMMISQIVTSSPQSDESQSLKAMMSQNATTSQSKRKLTSLPFAFTEHGVTMLASVLKSERAIKMSIAVVRAFIELKKSASQFKEISEQLELIKQHLGEHDAQLNGIYEAIENLLDDKVEKQTWINRRRIGFKVEQE
jgi:phage regulator Rha-like protein